MADNEQPVALLLEGLKELFASAKYSDLAVACGDRKWKVHKSVLCTQSKFFAKVFDGNFKEAADSTIDLSADDVGAVSAMLQYFYHLDYDNIIKGDINETALVSNVSILDYVPDLVSHVRVFVIADKYNNAPLKKLAEKKFRTLAEEQWHTKAFAMAIQEAMEKSAVTGPLCDVLVTITSEHAEELFTDKEKYEAFGEVVRSVPGFGGNLAAVLATTVMAGKKCPKEHVQYGDEVPVRCDDCKLTFKSAVPRPWLYCPNCLGHCAAVSEELED